MASTFDTDCLFKIGEILGEEAKIKSSVVLLAPTCNIPRNPLGGRAFESFSEDPHLSGRAYNDFLAVIVIQSLTSTT